jgi:hypothetical protein
VERAGSVIDRKLANALAFSAMPKPALQAIRRLCFRRKSLGLISSTRTPAPDLSNTTYRTYYEKAIIAILIAHIITRIAPIAIATIMV